MSNLNTLTPEQKYRQATRPQSKEIPDEIFLVCTRVVKYAHKLDGRTSRPFARQNYAARTLMLLLFARIKFSDFSDQHHYR